MIHTKVKISLGELYDEIGHVPVIPISIPDLEEITALAWAVHEKGKAYIDEAWGWPVKYEPEVEEPIPYSNLSFRPAVFSIGIYPVWFVSFTWENGKQQAPSVLIEDENLVTTNSPTAYKANEAKASLLHH